MSYWVHLRHPCPQVPESVGLFLTPIRHPPLLDVLPLMSVAIALRYWGIEFPFSLLSLYVLCLVFLPFMLFRAAPLQRSLPVKSHPGPRPLWERLARLGVSLL